MNHFTLLGAQSFSLAKKTLRRALSSTHTSSEPISEPSRCKAPTGGFVNGRRLRSKEEESISTLGHADDLCASVEFASNSSAETETNDAQLPTVIGVLHKWTNYIHGWQLRYFLLQGGTFAYYKSEHEIEFGCRGAITVSKAIIQVHEFDDCRLDVSVNDCVWYLRAENPQDRQKWTEALEACRADSGYGSQGDLCRHGSLVSLTSNKSLASSSSFKLCRTLNEKISELATYCDIVHRQVDTLQSYFDAKALEEGQCPDPLPSWAQKMTTKGLGAAEDIEIDVDQVDADHTPTSNCKPTRSVPFATQELDEDVPFSHQPMDMSTTLRRGAKRSVDFRGEALTFKATSAGILALLQHCAELMQQREDAWKKRLDQELEKRRRAEGSCRQLNLELHKLHVERSPIGFGGPDYEEGPHSALNEDEWYDAVDAALEKQDLEDRRLERLLTRSTSCAVLRPFEKVALPMEHRLSSEIERVTMEQVKYAMQDVDDGDWQLFSEDGEMKMYKREVEIDGLVCDPLKAVHCVKGISALEYLHYFFEPEYKMDWDTTLEDVKIVERISDDALILHQVHKRVWPASQRDAVFWSHFRRLPQLSKNDADDMMVVCNHDTSHLDVPSSSRTVRVGLTIAMLCQTVVDQAHGDCTPFNRQNVSCKITYVAQVNPGGWAPSSVLRVVYKREYPKFLKRFTQYVQQKVQGSALQH